MTQLTQVAPSATQRVLVFGPPKVGKTELVGNLAEKFNLIWFDCDQGFSTLFKLPPEWQARIDLITIPDSRVYPICIETWLKVIRGDAGTVCDKHGKWNCQLCIKDGSPVNHVELSKTPADTIVVFDSLTQLTNSAIANITRSQPDDYKMERDDWGNLKILIEKFLSQVQAARYNIVCITHEEEVEMVDGASKLVASSGSSRSSRNTAKYFDHVVYGQIVNGKHKFGSSTAYKASVVTGSRSGLEIEKKETPSLLDIFTTPDTVSISNEQRETLIAALETVKKEIQS